MGAADPPDLETYNRLFNERQRITGGGPSTRVHLPCPFCAAADWASWTVWPGDPDNVEVAMQRDVRCSACGRGARAIAHRSGSEVSFEMVQTAGDDPAPYLPPMRRAP